MHNPVVVAVILAVVAGIAVLLTWQRTRATKAARGEHGDSEALIAKGLYAEAAQLALKHDRFDDAMDLYLRGNDPGSAAQVAVGMGDHRLAAELYERTDDRENAAMAYERAGMGEQAKKLRASLQERPEEEAEKDPQAGVADARFMALRKAVGGDLTRSIEVQQEAQLTAEALIAVGEVARAAEVYRDADMIDEAVQLYVNVLGTPGIAAPLVLARGFHERAAELYEMAGQMDQAAMLWAGLARKATEPDKLLDRVEALSLFVAKGVLRDLTIAQPLSKATAPLHYRYGAVLERDGEVDRAIEVFQAMQRSVGNYRDIEVRVRRLARGEGISMKAPGVPRDLLKTSLGTFAVAPTDTAMGPADASRMLRDAAKAAAVRARRASSLPPPVDPKAAVTPAPTSAAVVVQVTQLVVPGRPGHPDRTLARGLEDGPIGLGALYDDSVRAAKDGPSVESLELMIAGGRCDFGNIELFYGLGLAALASGDWPRAQECFSAVEDASTGYRDAAERVLELARWQSMLALRMTVVGAPRPSALEAGARRYEVKGELGRGRMAVVYRARDTLLERDVALKFVSEELGSRTEVREMFLREARSVAQLNHPNIVTIYDSGVINSRVFMSMERVEGRTLDALLGAEGKIAVLESLRIARQVLEALDFAHERQIVHRDIKPSNMMRSTAGLMKLMDFGLARALSFEPKSSVIVGTQSYMSPEQMLGVGIDNRSDLFAMGATLYEMLTGVLPFAGIDRTKRPRSLRDFTPGVPEMIDKMVLQALEPEPAKRFQSAAEFMVPIKRVLFAIEKATRGNGPTGEEHRVAVPVVEETRSEVHVGQSEPLVSSWPPAVTESHGPEDLPVPEEFAPDAGFIDFSSPPSETAPHVAAMSIDGEDHPLLPTPPAGASSTKKTETGIVPLQFDSEGQVIRPDPSQG